MVVIVMVSDICSTVSADFGRDWLFVASQHKNTRQLFMSVHRQVRQLYVGLIGKKPVYVLLPTGVFW